MAQIEVRFSGGRISVKTEQEKACGGELSNIIRSVLK